MTEAAVAEPIANGSVKREIADMLTAVPLSSGYQPTLPLWALGTETSYLAQIYIRRDIELMLTHPMVISALDYFKGGLAGAEIECECESPEAKLFIEDHCHRFWETGMPLVQGGYEYGWIGLEPTYVETDNFLQWNSLIQFSPNDVLILTQDHKAVGMRVKNIADKGDIDLWMGTPDVPSKAFWYTHNPRYSRYYGRSQLLSAWRPWRRLAWKDGAETVTDTGVYRFAYAGPIVKYPEEDLQITGATAPGTTLNSEGKPMRYARDMARFIAEQLKAGAGVGFPSTKYPAEMGGGDKWSMELPKSTLNVSGLIEYVKYLQDQISYGIGVPPELLAASETGSGYSGRKLPLEAFLMGQQKIANAILGVFVGQILRPLVKWNFGAVNFKAKVKNILQQTRQSASGAATAETAGGGSQPKPGQTPDMRPDQKPGPVSPKGAPTPAAAFSLQRIERVLDIVAKIRARHAA